MKNLIVLSAIISFSASAAIKQPKKNLAKCLDLVKEDTSIETKKFCGAQAKSFQFFENANFDKCQAFHAKDLIPSVAIETCMAETKSINFEKDINLNKCLEIFSETASTTETMSICAAKSQTFDFINNLSFKACYDRKASMLLNVDALAECEEISKTFDFTSDVFKTCYDKTVELKLAHHAVDICVDEILAPKEEVAVEAVEVVTETTVAE